MRFRQVGDRDAALALRTAAEFSVLAQAREDKWREAGSDRGVGAAVSSCVL